MHDSTAFATASSAPVFSASEVVLSAQGIAPRSFRFPVADDAPVAGDLVSVARYEALKSAGTLAAGVGIVVGPADDAAALKPYLDELPAIGIDFPAWKDGRGYTHARRLRHHFGYQGPIIAVGDVLRDQLQYMWRSGMDAFHLRGDQDPQGCLNAFRLFSVFYQYPPK